MSNAARQARRRADETAGMDWWVLGSALALTALGLVMVVSSSITVADRQLGGPFHFAARQGVFLAAGCLVAWAAMRVPLSVLETLSRAALLGVFVLLFMVFVPGLGVSVNGSMRWIDLGPAAFQVAEGAKLLMVVFVAGYLVRQQNALQDRFMAPLKPLLLALLAAGLLLVQPDYGAAVLLLAITGGMVWLAGARFRYLAVLGLTILPLMASAALLEPYRLRRLTSFMNPWSDPYADGFQLTQALIAVGRGEWLGVGLGGSVQKLFYLPEAHTDFIFAVLAEELGLLGVVAVLALFGVLVGRAFWLGWRALEGGRPFAGYLAYGIALWIGLQVLISVGVNLGVLPTKGLTLPFISYGGSSLLVMCLCVGLLLRVGIEAERPVARARRRGGRS